MSDVGQVWEKPDGTIFLTLDEPAIHDGIDRPTIHCLVVTCQNNVWPEGGTLLCTWPFPLQWLRIV